VDTGGVAETIIKWSTWNDLIVVGLNNPPDAQPLKRLGSGIIRVIQRSPIPVLFVPNGCKSPLNRMLLAYDGSPKSDEALFVAAYMGMRWRTAVTVITVETDYTSSAAIDRARAYLERHNVTAQYVVRSGKIAEAVLETAASRNANFIVMGGFGFRPVMHMMLGSTVDRVLREYKQPILVCR
jgi:nucleotide-binding universal stress UspA family protein